MTKWNSAIHMLTKWMKQQQTDPQIIHALTAGLQAWCKGMTTEEDTPALKQQLHLVWDAALDGWLGMEWQAQQDAYWVQWQ